MKGITLTCLQHYLSTLPWGSTGCVKVREKLVKFVGIAPDGIREWQKDKRGPLGMALVKLRYFLEGEGYEVIDLAGIQEPVRTLGRLIAFGRVDFKKARLILGFLNDKDLIRLLHGKCGISSQKKSAILSILKEVQPNGTLPPSPQPQLVIADSAVAEMDEILHLLRSLDGVCSLLEPRLERILSDEVTPEQRQAFREKAGKPLVFDLSNMFYRICIGLNSICSEKSREINKYGRE